MLPDLPKTVTGVIVNTGNILNLSEIKKKAGQKPHEELLDSLVITLQNPLVNYSEKTKAILSRPDDDLHSRITEHERKSLKIGVKLFLNKNCVQSITEAIQNIFKLMEIDCIDNLILAFQPVNNVTDTIKMSDDDSKMAVSNGLIGAGSALKELKSLWSALEEYALSKQILQLGIADLDAETLGALYSSARVPPCIAQINLSACCVVPTDLQTLCKEKEIQLLTHSDPSELLTRESMQTLGIANAGLCWALRHQVHIKCRGVLACKGYVVGFCRE